MNHSEESVEESKTKVISSFLHSPIYSLNKTLGRNHCWPKLALGRWGGQTGWEIILVPQGVCKIESIICKSPTTIVSSTSNLREAQMAFDSHANCLFIMRGSETGRGAQETLVSFSLGSWLMMWVVLLCNMLLPWCATCASSPHRGCYLIWDWNLQNSEPE